MQQYIVDNYIKLETQRLDFYRLQQQQIRQEFFQGVVDAMENGETEGSAMTLVQKFGKPDIFLTMTCNPNWPEIK